MAKNLLDDWAKLNDRFFKKSMVGIAYIQLFASMLQPRPKGANSNKFIKFISIFILKITFRALQNHQPLLRVKMGGLHHMSAPCIHRHSSQGFHQCRAGLPEIHPGRAFFSLYSLKIYKIFFSFYNLFEKIYFGIAESGISLFGSLKSHCIDPGIGTILTTP